jgi:hypothetical protein
MGIMGDTSDSQTLCERCNQINLEALKDAYGCVHQPSFEALMDSASRCKLCKLILEACTRYLDTNRVEVTAETCLLGPVRLFATGQKDVSSGIERRNLEALQRRQLSPKVFVTVGKLERHLSADPSWSILLEMYALKGISAQF